MPVWIPPILVAGGAIIAAKWLYDKVSSDSGKSGTYTVKTPLDRNLERLAAELADEDNHKVAIMGQPGAGKSSLLKVMTRGKVHPLPVIGAQTDATDWSSSEDCVLLSRFGKFVFADVPGYDTSSHPVSTFQSRFPYASFDVLVLVLQGKIHAADRAVYRSMVSTTKRVLIARSFADSLSDSEREAARADIRQALGCCDQTPMFFFSNRTRTGVHEVFDAISGRAPGAA